MLRSLCTLYVLYIWTISNIAIYYFSIYLSCMLIDINTYYMNRFPFQLFIVPCYVSMKILWCNTLVGERGRRLLEEHGSTRNHTTTNYIVADGLDLRDSNSSKITFCRKETCEPIWETCYCCAVNVHNCYQYLDSCNNNCPSYNSTYPPPPPPPPPSACSVQALCSSSLSAGNITTN